jgi:hypothetical protein
MEELRKTMKNLGHGQLNSSLEHLKSRLSATFELSVPGYRINYVQYMYEEYLTDTPHTINLHLSTPDAFLDL